MKFTTIFVSVIALIVMMISSCAPFPGRVMREVNEGRPFSEIKKSPEEYLKKTILWGGVIIESQSRKDGALIIVRQTELDFQDRPTRLDESGGRFLIRTPEFLDPDIYAKGREITVVGEIVGTENLPLGDIQYTYPVVSAKSIHLWEMRSEYLYMMPPYPYWPYPYWYYAIQRHPLEQGLKR